MNKKNITYGMVFLLVVILSVYAWVRYFKIDYSETTWLTVQGYKSKGYVPYIKAVYSARGKECKEFIFGLGSSLARNEKQLLFAKVSEDDLRYTIRYPMNYKQGACEFWFGRGYVHIEERNELDEKKYPRTKAIRITQIYDGFVGVYDIKYFEPDAQYRLDRKDANPLQVNQYCQRSLDFSDEIYRDKDNKRQTKHWEYKRLICHPEGFYGKKPFFFFEPFVLKHLDFTYNIVVSEDVKGRYATEKQLKVNGLQAFVKGFSPSAKIFQTFKQKHNIKEP